ncbi:hypothetical protein WMW72_28645 [Paenibacillus filicis]|uniref:Uncharacterized protein n=1 Tax=Paenibacillus filicis TaxID=669464 RepID=A0ABU9DSN8_9BACL
MSETKLFFRMAHDCFTDQWGFSVPFSLHHYDEDLKHLPICLRLVDEVMSSLNSRLKTYGGTGFIPEHGSRNKVCFDFLYRFLVNIIDSKATIIVDYGLNNLEDVRKLDQWITERGGELITIHCVCNDEKIWSARLSERSNNPLPNQLITNLSELKEHYKESGPAFFEEELVVDTATSIPMNMDKILSYCTNR